MWPFYTGWWIIKLLFWMLIVPSFWFVGCTFRIIGAVFENDLGIFKKFSDEIRSWFWDLNELPREYKKRVKEVFETFNDMLNWLLGNKKST